MQNYGRDQAHSIYKLKQLCRPYYQLLIFVASWDGFLCRLHFLFRLVFLFVPTFCFSNYWFPKFLSLYYCLLVFFASFVFRFSTTDVQRWYNAHNTKKNRTRYARLGRRLELKWSRFRPRCEKVRSSPHVLLCWWLFHFAASTYNPGDLVDCRHKRGLPSTRVEILTKRIPIMLYTHTKHTRPSEAETFAAYCTSRRSFRKPAVVQQHNSR